MKHKLRKETYYNFSNAVPAVLAKFMDFQNCLNCKYFKEADEQCSLYKARPPAKIIAYGCDSHLDIEQIPF